MLEFEFGYAAQVCLALECIVFFGWDTLCIAVRFRNYSCDICQVDLHVYIHTTCVAC